MRYIVAVSGGVDSVVLLDMLAKNSTYQLLPTNYQLIVAHFDHGIREDSHEDAEFVESLAQKYGLEFELKREELGQGASEELARDRRYEFLRQVAKKYDGTIVTAHHADDAIETIAINLVRGTGWRGLAVLNSSDIKRPLLGFSKADLKHYAQQNKLEWREDSTNSSDDYLRNRLRKKLAEFSDDFKSQLLALRSRQIELDREVETEVRQLLGNGPEYNRYMFIQFDQTVAVECLRSATNYQLTRPQAKRALIAVKTAHAGTIFQAGSGIELSFTTRNFRLSVLK